MRPLFLSADQKTPGPFKKLYDVFSMFVTQLAFSYIAAPFIILSFSGSLIVWARTYFFVHIAIVASISFFYSSGKNWLAKTQQRRLGRAAEEAEEELEATQRTGGTLGLPEDPEGDLLEIRREVEKAVENRRRNGSFTGVANAKRLARKVNPGKKSM